MKEQNPKMRSFKKIILVLAMTIVIVGIILVFSSSNRKKQESKMPYNPGNVTVEIVESSGKSQISQPQNTKGMDMVNELGAATTKDIDGGPSDIQQAPGSTEQLLEGKEIEIKK